MLRLQQAKRFAKIQEQTRKYTVVTVETVEHAACVIKAMRAAVSNKVHVCLNMCAKLIVL
jgi:hypothetical protein